MSGISISTEQQLRRLDRSELPSWLPKRLTHRPDGYWRLPTMNGHRIIALEMECSGKGQRPYVSAGEFYNRSAEIDSVLWIVQDAGVAARIVRVFQGCHAGFRDIHNFVRLGDFKSMG